MFNGACDAVPKRQRACSTGVFDVSIYLYMAYFMPSEALAMMQSTCTALFNMKLKLATLQRVPLWAFKQVCSPATLTHLVAGPQPTPRRVSAMIDAFSKLTTLELQNSPAGYFARNTRVVFPNLTTLDISNHDFSETFYLSTNAPRLTTLTMNNMKAQDGTALQNTFAHLPLTTLRAHGLDFQILPKKRVASHILKFPNTLTCLDLTKAKLDDRCQRDLERLVHLKSLRLNACSHFNPIYLANLLRIEKLQRLYLDCLPMTREGVVALSGMHALERLSLYKVRGCVQFLINSLPQSLTELCICAPSDESIIFDLPPSITTLKLWCPGRILTPLHTMHFVTSLTLCCANCYTDTMGALFQNMPALKHLRLYRAVGMEHVVEVLNAADLHSITFVDCGFLEECGLLPRLNLGPEMGLQCFKANLLVPCVEFI